MAILEKYVPTDMDWSPCFGGWYVWVILQGPSGLPPEKATEEPHVSGKNFHVSIMGTDDASVSLWDLTFQQALDLYNSLTYIQSSKDLVAFEGSSQNNGWPGDRQTYLDESQYEHNRCLEEYEADGWPRASDFETPGGIRIG